MSMPTKSEVLPLLHKQAKDRPETLSTILESKLNDSNTLGTLKQSTSKHETVGYMLMFGSSLCFTLHSLCIRLSETKYNVPFTANIFLRGIIHTFLCVLYFLFNFRKSPALRPNLTKQQFLLLVLRGLIGSLSLLLLYHAVNLIPVSESISIFFFTSVLTLILSRSLLLEPIKISDISAVILSLIGACLISQSSPSSPSASGDIDFDFSTRNTGRLLMILGSFLISLSYIIIRYLGINVSYMSSVFSFSSSCIIVAFITGGLQDTCSLFLRDSPDKLEAILSIVVAALASFFAQCGLNAGLQKCRAGPGILITNIEVPLSVFLAFIFLGERPSVLTIIGSTCIVSGALVVGIAQLIHQRRKILE